MTENATGIILRTRPLTETSLIAEWLTRDLGRLSTVAKGARRPKSPFLGKLDLFYMADFSFARSSRSSLHTLREVSLLETHSALRGNLGYLRQASYCARLIEQSTEAETPLPAVFELLRSTLDALPEHPPQPRLIYGFELKLLTELGLQPDPGQAKLSPPVREIMQTLLTASWADIFLLKPTAAQVRELGRFLERFLIYHLERLPTGREHALSPA